MVNWNKKEIEDRVFNLSNETLLQELISLASGDDFDGCFTAMGEYTFECLQTEAKRRLIAASVLPDNFEWYPGV